METTQGGEGGKRREDIQFSRNEKKQKNYIAINESSPSRAKLAKHQHLACSVERMHSSTPPPGKINKNKHSGTCRVSETVQLLLHSSSPPLPAESQHIPYKSRHIPYKLQHRCTAHAHSHTIHTHLFLNPGSFLLHDALHPRQVKTTFPLSSGGWGGMTQSYG